MCRPIVPVLLWLIQGLCNFHWARALVTGLSVEATASEPVLVGSDEVREGLTAEDGST